jgi:hypothetical protein
MTLMATLSTDTVYQLHVRLADIEPPIWRQIVVPGQVTLFSFHRMLQVVMDGKTTIFTNLSLEPRTMANQIQNLMME